MNPLEKVPFATFYPLQNTCFFKNDFFKWTHTWNHPEHHRTALLFWFFCALCKPCANHGHARMALVMLGGHCVCLTPISRGRVSHSDSGLNTVGGVLACPWFVNDWHSLRIMPLEAVLIWRETLCKPQARKYGSGNAGRQ